MALKGEGGGGRYYMLETIRQYAWDKLSAAGESQPMRDRHLDYFVKLAEAAEPELYSAQQVNWLERLEMELDNFRATLEWSIGDGDVESGTRLAGELWRFWVMRGHWNEGYDRLRKVLFKSHNVSAGARAKALCRAGDLAFRLNDYAAARTLFEESPALYREIGEKEGIAFSLCGVGQLAQLHFDFAAARSLLEESLTTYRELKDKWGTAWVLDKFGRLLTLVEQSDLDSARMLREESLAIFQELCEERFR